jgi:Secretion system C-terminal sorting domain
VGESGIHLGEGRFTNTNISMTTIPGEENTLLFSWNVHSPFGYGRVQKMVDDEFVWQDGGNIYPYETSNTHSLIAYNDYELRMISWGNGYYLNRVDSNGEPMWDSDILLAGNDVYDLPVAIPLANGNMLFLMGEYISNGLKLVEHRITPDGEDLSGEQGQVITFLNGISSLDIRDCGDYYTIITKLENPESVVVLQRYTYESEEIGEALVLGGFENKYIKEMDIMNEYLLMFCRLNSGEQELSAVDFTGAPSGLLPENPYQYLEDVNSGSSPYTCKDGNDLYFCWQNGSISERPEDPDYFEIGFNWYMQKFRIPATEIENDEICSVLKLQLYPNPFNPELNISWEADKVNTENIEIAVFNIKGQQIRSWQVNSMINNLTWDGKNNMGISCSSGLYFVKVKTGGESICRKAVLLK